LSKLYPILILSVIASVNTAFAQAKTAPKKVIKIGVLQSSSRPDLDADSKGFEKAMTETGWKEGTHLSYLRQNAKGTEAEAEKIAQRFVDEKVDLIHSVASLASRAAVTKTGRLPIVFSSVTNPADEGIVPKKSLPGRRSGTNVTGVTDRWPVQLELEMYAAFFPKAKRWGTLFNKGDPRSLLYIQEMRQAAKRLGLELLEEIVFREADILPAVRSLAGKVQVINITFDSTALSAFDEIVKVCNEKKIPLFVGDLDRVASGAIAAYGSTYYEVGYSAGKKAAGILKGEQPGKIPWGPVDKLSLVINEKAARQQGVIIPLEFLKRADRVIRE
jgi:putative ABC transport system substrate-binding protein